MQQMHKHKPGLLIVGSVLLIGSLLLLLDGHSNRQEQGIIALVFAVACLLSYAVKNIGYFDERSKYNHAAKLPMWAQKPDVLQFYPDAEKKKLQDQTVEHHAMVKLINEKLESLGLPAPEMATDFKFKAYIGNPKEEPPPPYYFRVNIEKPTYKFPDYLTLHVTPGHYYTLAGAPPPMLMLFAEMTKEKGLSYAIDSGEGVWTNEPPYPTYHNRLKAVEPISKEQLEKYERATKFLAAFDQNIKKMLDEKTWFIKNPLPSEAIEYADADIERATLLGVDEENKPVVVPPNARDRHIYIVGKSGSGKSTLIHNMAAQDIKDGHGVCVIDPHGDLAEDVLRSVPEARIQDTIYFNVSDFSNPIPINIMNAETEAEIELLADDLLVTFKRLSGNSWGERMENILRYVFHSLLRYPGATFLEGVLNVIFMRGARA